MRSKVQNIQDVIGNLLEIQKALIAQLLVLSHLTPIQLGKIEFSALNLQFDELQRNLKDNIKHLCEILRKQM